RLPVERAPRGLLAGRRLPAEEAADARRRDARSRHAHDGGQAGGRDGDRHGRALRRRQRDRPGRSGVRAVTFASPWLLLALLAVPLTLAFGLWMERRSAKYA